MTLHELPDLIQGTDEWLEVRRGIITASVVGQLITVGPPPAQSVTCPTCTARRGQPCVSLRGKEPTPIKSLHEPRTTLAASKPPVYRVADNDTSRGLTATLVAERIAGWTEDTPTTFDMWRGVESEPIARDLYAEHHAPVVESGFMLREEKGWRLGYSPDGLVGDDGLIEIKSPRAKTHVLTILADKVPPQYMAQCQAGLLVSGRQWIDFVSYVGGLPLYVKRVTPDPKWHRAIVEAATAFEKAAKEMEATYHKAVTGLPMTERADLELVI